MSFELPPAVRDAESLRLQIENAVKRWTRDNRFGHGLELRRQAKDVEKAGHMAWRDRRNQAQRLEEFSSQVDSLKLDLQLAGRMHAFTSIAQFETIYRLARQLGKQVGGWKKEHSKRQNSSPQQHAPAERAQILSTRGASNEATG